MAKQISLATERKAWKDAARGEEVRSAGISSLQKTEDAINGTVAEVNQAASDVKAATQTADRASAAATAAVTNANNALENVEDVRQDIVDRVDSGEFKGDKGDKGDKGAQGQSGIMVPSAGMFSLYLDPATGDLFADYPTGESPPAFEYDATTGDLYYVTG